MVALAWGLLSFFGYVATVAVLVWPVGQLMNLFAVPHLAALGTWAFAWVLLSGLLALGSARLVFGAWCIVRGAAWLVLLVGAGLCAAQLVVLTDWTIARFGYNESDFVGPSSVLWAVVAGLAVAGFGVQVAPRWAAWSPLVAYLVTAVIGVSILLTNVPGLSDGLGRDSGPLAAVTVAAALYIGAVGILSFARLRHG